MKTCKECAETKELTSFHKNKMAADGYRSLCSSCTTQRARQKYLSSERALQARHNVLLGLRNAKGTGLNREKRRITYSKVSHKRRLQQETAMTEFDSFMIEEALSLAKLRSATTGLSWHVDHIVPLNHRLACGLHNGHNLQVVPAEWNIRKSNRHMNSFWPMPEQVIQ